MLFYVSLGSLINLRIIRLSSKRFHINQLQRRKHSHTNERRCSLPFPFIPIVSLFFSSEGNHWTIKAIQPNSKTVESQSLGGFEGKYQTIDYAAAAVGFWRSNTVIACSWINTMDTKTPKTASNKHQLRFTYTQHNSTQHTYTFRT